MPARSRGSATFPCIGVSDGCSHEHSDGFIVWDSDTGGGKSSPWTPASVRTTESAIPPRSSIVRAVVAPWVIHWLVGHLANRLCLSRREHDCVCAEGSCSI